jgi:hypothetical protein
MSSAEQETISIDTERRRQELELLRDKNLFDLVRNPSSICKDLALQILIARNSPFVAHHALSDHPIVAELFRKRREEAKSPARVNDSETGVHEI